MHFKNQSRSTVLFGPYALSILRQRNIDQSQSNGINARCVWIGLTSAQPVLFGVDKTDIVMVRGFHRGKVSVRFL